MEVQWNTVQDFDIFAQIIIRNLQVDDTKLLFGDLNFSWFEYVYDKNKDCNILIYLPRDDEGNITQNIDYDNAIIIDEIVYSKMIKYICTMFNLNFKVEKAKNRATKEAMIWEDEMNLQNETAKKSKNDIPKSFLLPLISAMVNHPGFKYKLDELKEVNIVQFMDSVKRLQLYENSKAIMGGMYSGFVDISKNKELYKQTNWLKDLGE